MKTPEEIKKGLTFCIKNSEEACYNCPYMIDCETFDNAGNLYRDALAYITKLESRVNNVNKFIDRYCKENCGIPRNKCESTYDCEACALVKELENGQAIDAESARHEQWVKNRHTCGESEWTCTVCGNKERRINAIQLKSCPNYGVKILVEVEHKDE